MPNSFVSNAIWRCTNLKSDWFLACYCYESSGVLLYMTKSQYENVFLTQITLMWCTYNFISSTVCAIYHIYAYDFLLFLFGFSNGYVVLFIKLYIRSQEFEETRAALDVQSASVEQLQGQLKELQEQMIDEERAREHARTLQRLASCKSCMIIFLYVRMYFNCNTLCFKEALYCFNALRVSIASIEYFSMQHLVMLICT